MYLQILEAPVRYISVFVDVFGELYFRIKGTAVEEKWLFRERCHLSAWTTKTPKTAENPEEVFHSLKTFSFGYILYKTLEQIKLWLYYEIQGKKNPRLIPNMSK